GEGWLQRGKGGGPRGPGETFLALAYDHVRARSSDAESQYGLESDVRPLSPDLLDAARKLNYALGQIAQPLGRVAAHLHSRLDKEAAELETATRGRIDTDVTGLERRSRLFIPAWRSMLSTLEEEPNETSEFADWFEI